MFDEATISADVLSGRSEELFLMSTSMGLLLMLHGVDIPIFQGPVEVETHGSSAWARSYKISVESTNGDIDTYFMKVGSFTTILLSSGLVKLR